MRSVNRCSGKSICCFFGIIFFCACGAHADIASPGPDNAALLYYQAFLRRPELDHDTFLHFNSVLGGAQPDEEVREYLGLSETRETLRIAEAATEILDCSWGIVLRLRNGSSLNTLVFQTRQLAFLLEVDARTLAADGNYRAALGRCLSVRRLAQHVADERIIGYLVSLPLHGRAFRCIQHILSSMSPDTDTLTWLQSQISTVQGAPPSAGRAMEINLDDSLEFLRTRPELLETWRQSVSERIEDESASQEILGLTDEELLERARESYNSFLSSANRVMGSEMPYQQKYVELNSLRDELLGRLAHDPVGILSLYTMDDVVKYHDLYVRWKANFNAVRAAIEIYLANAETGQLPLVLPAYLPQDPFSGQDFEYEVTTEGFVLRCREKEIGVDELWEYEFVVVQ
ncbi:MAG: hypothetical protein ACYS7Y_24045 [Planctomycetota bacterium]|jgi:hypothetical protein